MFFNANTRYSVSLKLKLVVFGQNWKENNSLEHHNISAALDGIDGSKTVDNTLEVSAKMGETKSKRS